MTTLSDLDVVALTLWGEARGEPLEGRIAVASVLRNRLQSRRWGLTYETVCLAPMQFSCWNAGTDPNHLAVLALAAAPTPSDPMVRECYWIADGLLKNLFGSRVERATHYYANSMEPPAWTKGAYLVATLGRHLFFEDVK